jgi:DNA primase
MERVLLAYDRDEAGEKAAAALAEKLMVQGLECFRLHLWTTTEPDQLRQRFTK